MRQFYLLLTLFICLFSNEIFGQTDVFWRTDGPSSSGDWEFGSTCEPSGDGQWFYSIWGGFRQRPDCFGSHLVYFDGNGINTMNLNSLNDFEVNQIIFTANATASRSINTDASRSIILNNNNGNPKINNLSTALHTFNVPIILNSTSEINPLDGDLTITGEINNNGNFIEIFGNNENTLTISGIISGTGGGIALKQNSELILSANNTYTGGTFVEAGTLILRGDLADSDVTVQSGATLEIDGDVTVKSLTVNAGGTVTINAGQALTIMGNLNNSGTVTLNSTSIQYSSLIVNGTATGNITYNRFTAQVGPTGTNDLIAPPVNIDNFSVFATANSNLATSGTTAAFATWDPNGSGSYTNLLTTNTDGLILGTGYRAATTDGSPLSFTGTINTSQVNKTIIDGSNSFWNLIGNPYPSYLDFGAFFAANSSKIRTGFVAVYGYNGDTSGAPNSLWTIWDGNQSSQLLAPGQGFFVASPTTGETINFLTTMQVIGSSDDFIGGRSTANNSNFAHAILNLNTASSTFVTNLYFRDINTLGLDPGYDTGAFVQNANGVYTHLVEDNQGIDLFNQSLPYNDLTDVIVPLVVNLNQNEEITFSLNNNSVVPDGINVYLEDTVTSTFTLLNNTNYQVTPESALNGTGRFFLRFTSGTLGIGDNTAGSLNIYHDVAAKSIVIAGQLNENTTAYIYDLQGRMVQNQMLQAGNIQQSINVSSLHTGIYIVKIGEQITRKVILK